MQQRDLIAGWFNVPVTDVINDGTPSWAVIGGDQAWHVMMPDAEQKRLTVFTDGGLPSYIDGRIAVPEAGDVNRTGAAWDALEGEQRLAVEVACLALRRLIGVHVGPESVVNIREEEHGQQVKLRLTGSWSELNNVRMDVEPHKRYAGQIHFRDR